MYGGLDLYVGTMITASIPYSANLFIGGLGFGGIEIFSSRRSAFFIECGGGGGGHAYRGSNIIAQEGFGFLGGGFVRVGTRFFK